MHDYSRLCKLAYLADILAHLNNLHSSREGSLSWHQYSMCGTSEGGDGKAEGGLWPLAGVGFFSLYRRPGYELVWRTHWHILNIMKAPLKDLTKGIHECFPTWQEWCHHLQDPTTSFIQRGRCRRLCLKPQVIYAVLLRILGIHHYHGALVKYFWECENEIDFLGTYVQDENWNSLEDRNTS